MRAAAAVAASGIQRSSELRESCSIANTALPAVSDAGISDVASNAAELNDIGLQISRIEGSADDMYDRGLELLYQKVKGGDAIEFIRGSEIYKHLEDTVDSLDDVCDEIEGIVIEHV